MSSTAASEPGVSRPNKRPLALNGISSTVEEPNVDFICPICFDILRKAHLTRCGHTFCYECIVATIDTHKRCPKCNTPLASINLIFPNFLLAEMIQKHLQQVRTRELLLPAQPHDVMDDGCAASDAAAEAAAAAGGASGGGSEGGLKQFITSETDKLALADVKAMLEILTHRKQMLEAESEKAQNRLLLEFLRHLQQVKVEQANHLQQQLAVIQNDLASVRDKLLDVVDDNAEVVPTTPPPVPPTDEVQHTIEDTPPTGHAYHHHQPPGNRSERATSDGLPPVDEAFNSMYADAPPSINFHARKRRMYAHFDDFVQSYLSVRSAELHLQPQRPITTAMSPHSSFIHRADTGSSGDDAPTTLQQPPPTVVPTASSSSSSVYTSKPSDSVARPTVVRNGLDIFRENLVKFSRYHTLRPLATMHYSTDMQSSSTIVSTIVFDKDNEFFAIGGVTKRIKIFDYIAVVRDTVDIHYPCVEMTSGSKISCIAFNSYHKNILATSDYEGMVNVWDVNTATRTQNLHEHEKRCWSVDFNEVDTRLMASGSDDSRVKLWSTNEERSIATLEAKANVCCVKFNPKSSCHLAFGSADHDVHYYDLRNLSQPLSVFKGHKKAVSYVKFLNTEEFISASTDSQLKLWNVNQPPHSLRSFTGHVNEKNFVGLATDSDYVACGSEDNALYIYYKGLSKQLFHYNIEESLTASSAVGPSSKPNEGGDFVSAVCWRKGRNVVLVANSRGLIKVLELI